MAPGWMGPRCTLRLLALFMVVYLQTADCQITLPPITLFPPSSTVSPTTTTTTTTYTTRRRDRDDMRDYHIAMVVLAAVILAVVLTMCFASIFSKCRSQGCHDVSPRC
ncbi:uncharacterized protein LOC144752956 [Lissotriton helveticus]